MQIALLGLGERAILLGARSRDAVPDLLFAADLFALGSQEEGLSLAVLEATAAGVPVVATAIGGLPEAVDHGKTGLLVPSRDPAALAEAFCTLLVDPERRNSFGATGIAHAQTRFAQETMITATQAVYRRVLHR
jgi:glycosyltransferase involved in cell wall biosynthesis